MNIGRCGRALHTSQSAVSRGLSEVEKIVGTRLFERTTRRCEPTPEGRTLIWHAEQVIAQIERAEADLDVVARGYERALNIGIMSGFSPYSLARTIHLVNERAPNLPIRFHSGLAEELLPDLVRGRYDLIATHFDINKFGSGDIEVETLYEETVSILAGFQNPLRTRRRLTWRDCEEQSWILLPPETSTRRAFDRQLLLHSKVLRRPVVEIMGFHYIVSLVQISNKVAALPSHFARWVEQQKIASCLPMPELIGTWPVCVARLRSNIDTSKASTLFIDCLKSACAEEANGKSMRRSKSG
jgi:DNA-binding transcriptional LysR family regulator